MQDYIKNIRFIYFIIMAAMLMFMTVMLLIQPPTHARPIDLSHLSQAHWVTGLIIVVVMLGTRTFFSTQIKKPNLTADRLLTSYIVRLAGLELGMMISLVMYLIHHDLTFLLYFLIVFMVYLFAYPSPTKLEQMLKV